MHRGELFGSPFYLDEAIGLLKMPKYPYFSPGIFIIIK
jgi:hypothetical protein